MIVNNFDLIANYLEEDNSEYFYELQILRRGKDHPELPSSNYCIKSYCIEGKQHLLKHMDEIIKLCETFKARAYISLQRRSVKKCVINAIKCYADRLYLSDCAKPQRIWWTAVGTTTPENKLWIVDIDSKNKDDLASAIQYIQCSSPYKEVVETIPTVDGYHIICNPFDLRIFTTTFNWEVKKNGLTLVYYNTLEND